MQITFCLRGSLHITFYCLSVVFTMPERSFYNGLTRYIRRKPGGGGENALWGKKLRSKMR
jgi:hypothetical protein